MPANNSFEIIIDPNKKRSHYWLDVWKFRELFYFFAWRDLIVRYKQTFIGVAWSVVRPLLTMVVFAIIFGSLAKLPSHGVPYVLLVGAAMLPWQFFANSFADASNSLLGNAGMLTKVYFPRLIIPVSTIIVSLVDFLISFLILIALMMWYHFIPGIKIISIFFFLLIAMVTSLGAGLFVSAMNVKYRDFKFIVPFIVQFGLFISPVGFTSSIVPEKWKFIYSLNPMVGVIEGFRWAILGGDNQIYIPGFITSIVIAFLLLITGIIFFRSTERRLADFI